MAYDRSCEKDDDCPGGQYCYDYINCVNFTKCASFHREEAALPARDGSQCGPCLNGFQALSHGSHFEVFCLKLSTPIEDPESSLNLVTILCIIISILVLISVTSTLVYIYVKKRIRKRNSAVNVLMNKKRITLNKRCSEIGKQNIVFHCETPTFKPTAPPEGHTDVCNQSLERRKPHCCQPFHDNGVVKPAIVNDKSQNASPWRPPNWVHDPNLSNETSNNNGQSSTQCNRVRTYRLPAARDNPDTNEQLAILIPGQTVEYEDNARNTALMEINSSSSDDNDDTNSTTFNDDENDNRNGEDGTTIKTVVINQNITMNLNVSN